MSLRLSLAVGIYHRHCQGRTAAHPICIFASGSSVMAPDAKRPVRTEKNKTEGSLPMCSACGVGRLLPIDGEWHGEESTLSEQRGKEVRAVLPLGVAADAPAKVYVTGRTASIDFPTTIGTIQALIEEASCPLIPDQEIDSRTAKGDRIIAGIFQK